MFELYRKGLMLPSQFYEMKTTRNGEYKILQAFLEYEVEMIEKENKNY